MTKQNFPNFEFEEKLWGGGYEVVVGADEVGRGSFAGPVVAAAVAFSKFPNFRLPIVTKDGDKVVIRDSKTTSEKQRVIAEKWIRENATYCEVGEASVNEINEKGISAACYSAFRRALRGMEFASQKSRHFLLVDGYNIPSIGNIDTSNYDVDDVESMMNSASCQLAIKKGDQKSFSISAASIVAKVYRDKLMQGLGVSKKYFVYEWHVNKGYGTKTHRQAILRHGITKHHRTKYVQTFLDKLKKKR